MKIAFALKLNGNGVRFFYSDSCLVFVLQHAPTEQRKSNPTKGATKTVITAFTPFIFLSPKPTHTSLSPSLLVS